MRVLLYKADGLLRGSPWATRTQDTARALVDLVLLLFLFGMLYGAAMGSYGGVIGPRFWQVVFAAIKVPLLLLAAFFISLPSFFVVNTLAGLRDDMAESLRALVATQAGLAIILGSLAPFTVFWYASSPDTAQGYRIAVMFNGLMFAVASFAAQWMLRRYYRPLIERNWRHRWMLRCWLVVYVFVAVQMAWILRPFVGDPHLAVQFFRDEAWGNAYVEILDSLWVLIRGR